MLATIYKSKAQIEKQIHSYNIITIRLINQLIPYAKTHSKTNSKSLRYNVTEFTKTKHFQASKKTKVMASSETISLLHSIKVSFQP